jgi:hypothetical protein
MRTAKDIVSDYRARGYTDERIRALANNRPEPIRSEILALLDLSPAQAKAKPSHKAEGAEEVLASVPEPVADESDALPADTPESAVVLVDAEAEAARAKPEPVLAAEPLPLVTAESVPAMGSEVIEELSSSAILCEPEPVAEAAAIGVEDIMEDTAAVAAAVVAPQPKALIYKLDSDFVREAHANLAPVQVERMTQSEFFAVQAADITTKPEAEVISVEAVAEAAGAESAVEEAEVANAAEPAGEVWPTVAAVEAAAHDAPMATVQSSAFVVFPEADENTIDLSALGQSKAGRRTIEVLRDTIRTDPDFAAAVQDEIGRASCRERVY